MSPVIHLQDSTGMKSNVEICKPSSGLFDTNELIQQQFI